MWDNCSHVLPNFEYCCLKHSCNPVQSATICLNNSYHNLASLVRVKKNLCTFAICGKLCASIQSFVLSIWASASSSGLPENSGFKHDQINWGWPCCTWICTGCAGFGTWAGRSGGCTGFCCMCCAAACSCFNGEAGSGAGAVA